MALRSLWFAVAAAATVAGAGADEAKQAPQAPQASIAFASKNIWNWQVIDNRTVLIETTSHKWYKATLLSPCIDLPYSERIGFQSNTDGSFDKFGAIQTRGTRCPLISLTATEAPATAPKKQPDAAASAVKP
jgi:hypothetical protein